MAKSARQNIKLVSSENTGVYYVATVPTKGEKASKKMKVRKYDKKLRKHVMFVQTKLEYKSN